MLSLELRAEDPEFYARSHIELPFGEIRVWPVGQPISTVGDPRIFGTRFLDVGLVHGEFSRQLVTQAAAIPANIRSFGGKKVRDLETWNMPAARLLTLRALLMFCRVYGVQSAHVVDRWANVMQQHEYSAPHCHYESEAAVVYFLDAGDPTPERSPSGRFELIDSRIPFCCTSREYRPTRGLMPELTPGMMLLFPAEFLHHVHPYEGRRPRITLAWNLSSGVGEPRDPELLARQNPGKFGITTA